MPLSLGYHICQWGWGFYPPHGVAEIMQGAKVDERSLSIRQACADGRNFLDGLSW